GLGQQARDGRDQQTSLGDRARRARRSRARVRGGLSADPGHERARRQPRGAGEVLVPALARELDRGRHLGDHAQHPRRARARPARRAARRQGRGLEGRTEIMTTDVTFTEEHDELRATIRAFLAEHSDELTVRAQMASERGYDPEVWRLLAEQLGLAGLIVPEVHGGAGMGEIELLVAMEEMGRALLCAPYLGTAVLGTHALLACADASTQKELLAGIA